ncbi:hypothetical protein MERGE_000317 [Pneumocystis wakefieldiae]|uniref:DUF3752 domain-containing protein n=1 Tax=Pneumocystis wakefieldiae TaxID=38082 RepID=A0A899FVU0_9ASCO|nr:hypothetical protein MERGE_000317 [Pneumocystis wakefieldiae]
MIASDTTLIPKNSLEGADIRTLNEHLKKPYIIGPLLPDDISEKNEYENKDGNKGDMGFPEKTGKTGQILSSEDVESDDDEIGPSVSDFLNFSNDHEKSEKRIIEFEKIKEKRSSEISKESVKTNEKKRDDWMVVPPDASYLNSGTCVKARTFNTGKSARLGEFGARDMNSWTESYQEKQKQLKQEAIGSKIPAYQVNVEKERSETMSDTKKQKTSFENKRPSLYDMHLEKNKGMIDDPSKRMFDREKDFLSGNYMNFEKRQKLMDFAKDLSRFSSGSYL